MGKTKVKIPGVVVVPEALVGMLGQVANRGKCHLVGGSDVTEAIVTHQIRLDVVPDVADDVLLDAEKIKRKKGLLTSRKSSS